MNLLNEYRSDNSGELTAKIVGIVTVVVGGFFVVTTAIINPAKAAEENIGPPGGTIPQQEANFCSIIEAAKSKYDGLWKSWKIAANGIVEKQLATEMKSVRHARNEAIFKLLEPSFRFERWLVTIKKIGAPTATELNFSFHPLCSSITTIHVGTQPIPAYIALLSTQKQGDPLTVTGRFVASIVTMRLPLGTPISPNILEASLTESGAVDWPEYHAVVSPAPEEPSPTVRDTARMIVPKQREDAAYLRGLSSLERQDYDQAIVEFTEAIQTDPSDRAFAYLKRATAYEKKGNRDSAIADYRMAVKLNNSLKQQVDAAIRKLTAKR